MKDQYTYVLKRKSLPIRLIFSAAVTAVSCLIAYLIMVPLSESMLAKLFSAPETSDFTMSDLFIQFADARPVRHLEEDIAIVDLGYAGRLEIADALEMIEAADPKVVGLDVNFPSHKGSVDSLLLQALLMQKDIVLPLGLEQEGERFVIEDKPFFYDEVSTPSLHYASVNLPARSSRSSIREFETGFKLENDSVMPSYVVELVRIADPEKYEQLMRRGNMRETIDYASREFTVVPYDEIFDRLGELTGKYVLVGSLGDAYDLHATPLNSNIPGLMVHASALATLLDGAYYKYVPDALDYVVGVLVCFLLVFASESLPGRGKDMALRALQLAFLILVVWLGYTLFVDKHTIMDLSFTFFVVGLGLIVLDLGNGIWNVGVWIRDRRHRYRNRDDAMQSDTQAMPSNEKEK